MGDVSIECKVNTKQANVLNVGQLSLCNRPVANTHNLTVNQLVEMFNILIDSKT